jgi:hypothetical protein
MKYRSADWFSAQEAVWDDEAQKARVILVRPGWSQNRKNWTPAALKRAVEEKIFDGAAMYPLHAKTPGAGRDLTQLLSAIESTELDQPTGGVAATVDFLDEAFYRKAKKAPHLFGTSIDVFFTGQKAKAPDGLPGWAVEHIAAANSVDWVSNPAAGGGIDRFLQAQESEDEAVIDWEKVNLEDLEKNRPDLVKSLRATESAGGDPESGNKGITREEALQIAQEAVKDARKEWDDQASKASATRQQIADRVNVAALPPRTKTRLIGELEHALESYDEARVDAAVKNAQEEIKEIRSSGPRVVGMGGDSGSETTIETPEQFVSAQESAAPMQAIVLRAAGMEPKAQKAEGAN